MTCHRCSQVKDTPDSSAPTDAHTRLSSEIFHEAHVISKSVPITKLANHVRPNFCHCAPHSDDVHAKGLSESTVGYMERDKTHTYCRNHALHHDGSWSWPFRENFVKSRVEAGVEPQNNHHLHCGSASAGEALCHCVSLRSAAREMPSLLTWATSRSPLPGRLWQARLLL